MRAKTDTSKTVTPDKADTWHNRLLVERARANLGLKRFDEALSAAQQACDDDPADEVAKQVLADIKKAMSAQP